MCDSYESLPESSSLSTQMMAGAMAGFMEHGLMYPVDCIKTRMQCLRPPPEATYSGVTDGLYKLFTQEGFRRSFKGISAVIFGAGPAHALYFGCYEQTKALLAKHTNHSSLAQGLAGGCATVLHDAVMTPADVVKQRMQLYGSTYNGCRDCVHRVVSEEGVRALYRSYAAQLLMNVPFGVTYFITYEATQDKLNAQREYRPLTHIISGAISGGAAAALSTPLDVCKTVLNTQSSGASGHATCKFSSSRGFADPYAQSRSDSRPLTTRSCGEVHSAPTHVIQSEYASSNSRFAHTAASASRPQVVGIRQACAHVYASYGFAGFFRGAQARILQQMPSTAISWSVYEFFKWQLSGRAAHRHATADK